jgi:HK97 family phage major capsid protein
MALTVKALMEKRAAAIAKAREINETYSDADGNLPAEHQAQYDAAMKDADGFKSLAEKTRRDDALTAAEASLDLPFDEGVMPADPNARIAGNDGASGFIYVRYDNPSTQRIKGGPQYIRVPAGDRGAAAYKQAFSKAMVNGVRVLSHEEFAALRSDDAAQAGYLVASEQFASELLKAVDDLVFVRSYARIHTLREADSLGIRKRTAKAATFGWSSELSVSTDDSTLAFGKKTLTPHHATGMIKVSRDLIRRSVISADMIVREELARDSAELMEEAYLTGSGSGQPLGVFTASNDGISTARDVSTGSTSDFTADQIIAAKYTLKQQYRNGGARSGARWLFHRDGISKIARLKDGNGNYLLHPGRGLTGDEWDTLVGYPVDESEFAPNTFTTQLYVGLLANWRYYEIADALDMEVQVLDQLYAATNQIGYIARLKTDGMPTLEEAFVRLKTA